MTGGWPNTIWSEARQIGALLQWPEMPGDGATPDRFFAALRAEGRNGEAALFLGQALPRYEAVQWAAEVVARHDAGAAPAIMAAVHDWLHAPSDARRRAAHAAIDPTADPGAAEHCALAVFMSGGSLLPDEDPPQPASKDATGRFAAGAVLIATARASDRADALAEALDRGETLAQCGQEGRP
jgi:hypothetical protein